ncbi:MAG TPA: MarR family transcriptional regulator [Jiangellaceae bacterium]|nr:MarR family transcriptional regulator [Jiangellaceae bacterium]
MVELDRVGAHERLERELSVLLRRARSLSMTLATEVHEGLDAAGYGALVAVDHAGEVRASDLAGRFGLDKSTVSRQLGTLEALHLIERVLDPGDARARLVRLTQEGRARLGQVREARRRRLRESLGDWSTDDVAALGSLLAAFNDSIKSRLP